MKRARLRRPGLREYRRIRDFNRTPEPEGRRVRSRGAPRFVVQEHHASVLHYDFRLEIGGVLKSWSVPKGPSLDPAVKRLAVEVDDHPLEYLTFVGSIPEGNYGAGQVFRWDVGTIEPIDPDPPAAWRKGSLRFRLQGERLGGEWRLFRMRGRRSGPKPLWLLIKVEDAFARAGHVAPVIGESVPLRRPRGSTALNPQVARQRRKLGIQSGLTPRKRPRTSPPTRRRTAAAIPLEEFLLRREAKGAAVVDVEGTPVEFSHLDRVYWPKEGITKFELLRYYAAVWPRMKPFLAGRPAILHRYPRGIDAPRFLQHDLEGAPRYLATRRLTNEKGREIDYAVYTSLASLLYLTNLGALEHHPWHSTVRDLDRPDWLVLDLDPAPGTPWKAILDLTLAAREVFDDRGLKVYPKTSGSRGIHLYLPLERREKYPAVAASAKTLAGEIARRRPRAATLERTKSERKGKIYIDSLQNARGKSMAAPYSARGRAGGTVSMPLSWADVERGVRIQDFTIRTAAPEAIDPWGRFFDERQPLRDSA